VKPIDVTAVLAMIERRVAEARTSRDRFPWQSDTWCGLNGALYEARAILDEIKRMIETPK
jgi:hypothetical protein